MTPTERELLIDEYLESLRLVRQARRLAQARRVDHDEQAALDCQHLASMERDLLWTLDYLETGEVPDYHRGTSRWTVPVDPDVLRRIVKARTKDDSASRWASTDATLTDLLCLLTPREKEAFIMVRGRGISFRHTAEFMRLKSSGTVSNLVRRAERKLRRAVIGYESESFYHPVVAHRAQ